MGCISCLSDAINTCNYSRVNQINEIISLLNFILWVLLLVRYTLSLLLVITGIIPLDTLMCPKTTLIDIDSIIWLHFSKFIGLFLPQLTIYWGKITLWLLDDYKWITVDTLHWYFLYYKWITVDDYTTFFYIFYRRML